MVDTIESALQDLRNGKLIIVCDDEDRENEGDLVGIAEIITPEHINFMAKYGRGLICAPVSMSIADRLGLKLAEKFNTGANDTNFTDSIDYKDVTTGISAFERALTISKLTDPSVESTDFRRPGHIFPLISKNGGVLVRAGHTEAATDLARLAGYKEAGVICEIMSDDGTMALFPELKELALEYDLKVITIKDLIEFRIKNDCLIKREVEIALPSEYGDFKMFAYTNDVDSHVHLAMVKGDVSGAGSVMVRVHSECLTGDVFHSNRCDCGPQLDAALRMIEDNGSGVLLYMRQEGRGIGLLNKLKAYKLQEEGYDTVDANLMLGFSVDLRNYGIGAQILRDLGLSKIKLLTNNPRKIIGLSAYGLEVIERLPIVIPSKTENESYLHAKEHKLGHIFKNHI